MRSDKQLDGSVRKPERWSGFTTRAWNETQLADVAVSLSGHERNHLFLSARGRRFDDVSGISGLDTLADSRSFALLDYDRDGWSDIALVNTNAPLLNLFRNQIGKLLPVNERGRVIALRFVGGNREAKSSERFGNRDGYGAQVTLQFGDLKLTREHRAGDGFSIQNSNTMLIGIGARKIVDVLTVRWPSGAVQELKNVAAGRLVTVYENPAEAPGQGAFVQQAYSPKKLVSPQLAVAEEKAERLELTAKPNAGAAMSNAPPELRMYTTTATWCPACKKSLPQLQTVRDAFPAEALAMYGVPIDPEDTAAKLAKYVKNYAPAYEILTHLKDAEVAAVLDLVIATLDSEVLPSSIVTDGKGRVLYTDAGVPTISVLRGLLGGEVEPH